MRIRFIATGCAVLFAFAATNAGSMPTTADVVEAKVTRVQSDRMLVTWPGAGPVDVYVADKPSLDAKAMKRVSDDDMDGRYEHREAGGARSYFLLVWEMSGKHVRVAERVLTLERGSNFRDVGGYESVDGQRVRWGLIYRTGAMPQLTDRDYELLGRLGIRVFCDLRSVEERVLARTQVDKFSGARYAAVDYPASEIFKGLVRGDRSVAVNDAPPGGTNAPISRNLYRDWPTSLAPQYRHIFDALLAGEAPLAFNCSAGQDRTGVATALVLSALGVPRDTILRDYHLSTLHRRPEFERGTGDYEALAATNIVAQYHIESRKQGSDAQKPRPLYDDAGRARLLATFDEIESRWGSIERYLDQVLGVDAADVRQLRALYLE